jgi:hypothetical protein
MITVAGNGRMRRYREGQPILKIVSMTSAPVLITRRSSRPSTASVVLWWARNDMCSDLVGMAVVGMAVVGMAVVGMAGFEPAASCSQSRFGGLADVAWWRLTCH